MEYISSDTNVWLDFAIIKRLEIPFKLPYTYIMNEDAIENELLSPKELRENLVELGLQAVELSEEEFYLAGEYNAKYQKPSLYDCVALAVAKVRGITLMTGDGPLRRAAEQEGVAVIGTIGVLDQLYEGKHIEKEEYVYCMKELLSNNGQKVRLPEKELQKRIDNA
ncbi:MAG: PIN domain-containing protein [Tyzzerella sp.]|nr:PIN domain-containing protein [Tyzzerella sp.]